MKSSDILDDPDQNQEGVTTVSSSSSSSVPPTTNTTPPATRIIIDDFNEITERTRYVIGTSEWLSVCSTLDVLGMICSIAFDSIKQTLNRHKKGQHKGIRWIICMGDNNSGGTTQHDIQLVRELIDLGMHIRHVNNIPLNFSVTDKEFDLTIPVVQGSKICQSTLLISNEPAYIRKFGLLFDELWKNGVDVQERIKEIIEQGIRPARIEIIHNPRESLKRAWDMVASARKEVLLMFSTANAFRRQVKMGGLDILAQAIKNGARPKVLIPEDELIEQTLRASKMALPIVEIRSIDRSLETRITILVVDRSESMIFELKDDTKDNSYEAVGVATYSSSSPIALSYATIFESLWKQSELYERLQMHDKMQKEFINIAAHELRTPVQPILAMSELLEDSLGNRREDIRLIARNARRLERLIENILDVTRIESQMLKLNKEQFNLNDVVLNVIEDYQDQIKSSDVKIVYQPANVYVQADRDRISQVLSNLLSNALKFTKGGTVSINIERGESEVTVGVKDTGLGIDNDIMPRLFSKFATKSEHGTGLGLYISKSIIEAHGGRIWAKNNDDDDNSVDNTSGSNGRGATFYFSLPL